MGKHARASGLQGRGGGSAPPSGQNAAPKGGAPPSLPAYRGVIVDEQLNVVEFLGNTGPYLQLPIGKARLNLRLMLGPGLQHPVLEAVRECREQGKTVCRERLPLTAGSGVRRVNLEVRPLDRHPSGRLAVRVLFMEAEARAAVGSTVQRIQDSATSGPEPKPRDIRVDRLKDELLTTRASLESIIEEQEIGTARLKSAYYQLESVNAELEAANEELAAANVELEALNDELAATIRQRDAAEEERRLLEAELVRTQRLEGLRVMAGGVAHDFNNLLTSIVGNSSVLLEELPGYSELRDAAEQIDRAAQHAAGLVKQMLAFCGKGALTAEALDLSTLVRDSVDLLRASISKTVELRCDLGEDLPTVEADATQVRQVLINLVVNASEAIGNVGGVIEVSTRRLDVPAGKRFRTSNNEELGTGTYIGLEVCDTGRGMSAETQARLFEPYFSTKLAGRGLGMAAVQGIARSHGGAIQVRSRQAEGSEIEVFFPASAGKPAPPQEGRPEPAADLRGTVLVVDDEESIRNVATALLKRAGLHVITAADGSEALAVLRRKGSGVEAILLDVVMPQMSGEEVLKKVRQLDPCLPVILCSGYSAEMEIAEQLSGPGPTSFLAKPYRSTELVEKVGEALAARAARRSG